MCSNGGAGGAAAAVAAAVEALAAAEPADLPDAALGEELVGLRAQLDRLEAQWLRRLGGFDARGGGAGQGYLSLMAALVEVCRRALDGGELPQSGGERPHLSVVVDLATLQTRPATTPAAPDPAPAATEGDGPRAASLEITGPISAEALRRLGCDATVSRILMAGCQ